MGDEIFIVEKEMGMTHADFFRSFPNILQGEQFSIKGRRVSITSESGIWTIELGPESTRNIALLSLPRIKVTLKFEHYKETDRRNALERFDRAFQRAGG